MVAMNATHQREEVIVGALNGESPGLENSHLQHDTTAISNDGGASLWLKIGFWVSIVIAVAAAARRFVALVLPSATGSVPSGLDATFASRTTLTLAHIIPATAFVVLAPFVVFRRSEKSWLENALLLLGVVVGITAFAMSVAAFGGWIERSAVLFFNSLFLFSLGRAFLYRQAGAAIPMRRWLMRAIGILLGIATTRPVMGIFFATIRFTRLEPNQFFGVAFWIGFSINTIIVETWLHAGNHVMDKTRAFRQIR
jgi:hypothetical protein